MLVSMRLGHPSVYLIKDVQGNAEKVAKDLKSLLKPFGIIVKYVRGRKIWDQIRDLISQGFAQGKVLLVMTTQNTELECLNNFLEQEKITGEFWPQTMPDGEQVCCLIFCRYTTLHPAMQDQY